MVEEYLKKLGCKEKSVGFKYMVELIKRELDGYTINPLFKNGYSYLSEKYGKTSNSIEKSIQTCISNAWNMGRNSYLNEFFGETNKAHQYKSTNKQFIFTVLDRLKLEMMIS